MATLTPEALAMGLDAFIRQVVREELRRAEERRSTVQSLADAEVLVTSFELPRHISMSRSAFYKIAKAYPELLRMKKGRKFIVPEIKDWLRDNWERALEEKKALGVGS